ncbi:class C sortase [Blautia wexlerae]|jgi:sortase A|uniref:class C sortase n=1 Tax=Blautia wexlerae TaxID=418240 RepID=UPI0035BEB4B9
MKKIVKVFRGVGYLIAFSLILYPVVSNYVNQLHSTTIATDYEQEVSHLSENLENEMIEQAREYNKSLIGISSFIDPFSDTEGIQTEDDVYNNLLKIDDTGMMGYIDIPKLDIVLPVYHGISEKVLQSGVGHLPNTSLPVGGESSHAVLSGHRGLANAKIFTDLNKMEVGDVFYIKVLHHTFAYQVDQILTVLPSETDALQIEKGKDYVTLVTCTPYAVNTHRLLVRGTRIPYEEAKNVDEEVGLHRTIPFYMIILIGGIAAVVIIWIGTKIYSRRKEKVREQKK